MEPDPLEVQKYINQIQRKREYNRNYYYNRVKPKRDKEKQELAQLHQRVKELEEYISYSQQTEPNDLLKQQKEKIKQLQAENAVLLESLEIARRRTYELMMEKADQLLPKLGTLSLS